MDLFKKRNIISFLAGLLLSLLIAFVTKNLVRPGGIFSGGFIGIAITAEII